jgi:hypothetical protein
MNNNLREKISELLGVTEKALDRANAQKKAKTFKNPAFDDEQVQSKGCDNC